MQTLAIHLFYVAVINLAIVLKGYTLLFKKASWPGWLILFSGIVLTHLLLEEDSPVMRMLGLIATTFTGMKVIAVQHRRAELKNGITFYQWLLFSVGWAGMRAQPFTAPAKGRLPNAWEMIRFGGSRLIAGVVLIFTARILHSLHWSPDIRYALVTILLLVAFSLILHFGVLSISAGMWRLSGINTYYLFRSPAKSRSLSEFWGKRWNLAFSEMTSETLFRPLKTIIGAPKAILAAFAFSGLLHEIALSLPVNSGFGLPLTYFILQGGLVLLERRLIRKNNSLLRHTVTGRIWVFFWLVVPSPLLFHQTFIREVVWPLAGIQ